MHVATAQRCQPKYYILRTTNNIFEYNKAFPAGKQLDYWQVDQGSVEVSRCGYKYLHGSLNPRSTSIKSRCLSSTHPGHSQAGPLVKRVYLRKILSSGDTRASKFIGKRHSGRRVGRILQRKGCFAVKSQLMSNVFYE